uniref:Uncharacterized protein MANES_15G095600 n=1 Tax=Rhizophora mucronata TaxID=61149 RepID=A0A2P2LXM6_RHIMU
MSKNSLQNSSSISAWILTWDLCITVCFRNDTKCKG